MRKLKKIIDGNGACSLSAYLFSEIACIYPITPSSPMASCIDDMSSNGVKNMFGDVVKVVQMQSEAGVAGALHGALLSGSLASSFTASQGLLLMIPNMYKIAGECLPLVLHVASRTVATHALSIFGDHSDVYAARQTGFCMLCSVNASDAYYLGAISHLAAINGGLPFLHFFDGFRTSHELNVIDTIDDGEFVKLLSKNALDDFRRRSLNVGSKLNYGMAMNEDIYFQCVEARNSKYTNIEDVVNDLMEKINAKIGSDYAPFTYYGCSDAKSVIVAMGSVCDTIRLVIDNEPKRKIGLICVHLFRPFSTKYLKKVLPKSVKNIAVLDRSREFGSVGEPLFLDVSAALSDLDVCVCNGRYGLSSKNTTPDQIVAVYDMLDNDLRRHFTIGIDDDVTNLSLNVLPYELKLPCKEILVYGFGSDGMVSTSKDLLKIIGDAGDYVQGYFEYDSKKSGGVTVSHLRIGKSVIHAPYYVNESDLLVVTKDVYFHDFHLLDKIRSGGILLINTSSFEQCVNMMTSHDYSIIKNRDLKIYTIDASSIALRNNIKGKISKIMEAVMLSLLNVKRPLEILEANIKKQFMTKGSDVIDNNIKAIHEALDSVKKESLPLKRNAYDFNDDTLFGMIKHRLGNELKVSSVLNVCCGGFENDQSKKEKRKAFDLVAKWNKDNCISCGLCALVCPHAVIRPFMVHDDVGISCGNYNYYVGISEADCTSCGLCVDICPGKNGVKALSLGKADYQNQELVNRYFEKVINPDIFPSDSLKAVSLAKPKFSFPGACSGCGETSYIKILTQLFGDSIVIANATGCSSIYGGSAPSTCYSIPWANSLFEDNSEFAYGINLSYENKRKRIWKIISEKTNDSKLDALYASLRENFNDFAKSMDLKNKLAMENISGELRSLLDYVPSRTVWAIGGDGWAYDIGFGGIDHVLATNSKVKILVLDTEVYSNTGGQMSKASHIAQVASFAESGKKTDKKDLFRIALSYPNCYVASVCFGANMMQTIKAFREANMHDGPSIIIAYCPCAEHGIKGGLSCTTKEEKLAVLCGYTLLMRYKPEEKKLMLDYKNVDFERYGEFLDLEVRYSALKLKNASLARELLLANKKAAMARFDYYKKLADE